MKKNIVFLIVLMLYSSCLATPSGIVAHWKLNDDAATDVVIDSAGNNNGSLKAPGDATTAQHTTTGLINKAFSLDGVDDYIDTMNPFQSVFKGSFTFACWAKLDDGQPSVNEYFFGCQDAGIENRVSGYVSTDGKVNFIYESNNATRIFLATTDAVFANGATAWTHLVFVGEADSLLRLYINGVELKTEDASGNTFSAYVSGINLFVGGYNANSNPAANSFLNGVIDNTMLFSRALTAEETRLLYNNGNGTEIIAEMNTSRRYKLRTRGRYK